MLSPRTVLRTVAATAQRNTRSLVTSSATTRTTAATTYRPSALNTFGVTARSVQNIRHYASSGHHGRPIPPPRQAGFLLYTTLLIGAGAGAAYFLNSPPSTSAIKGKRGDVDYYAVYKAIAELLEDNDYDDGSYGPILLRLAWHAAGTYDKRTHTGGSDGATMRYKAESAHGANAGLEHARKHIEQVKTRFPDISYADLWSLGGVVAIQEMGGPQIPWRPGRADKTMDATPPEGRLPDASKGAQHIRDIFYRMGFNDQEIVALVGAHALGRCHTTRSGFDGPWTFSPTVFTNDFFEVLLEQDWVEKKWGGPSQFVDKATGQLMMLPTDMAIRTDKEFVKWAQIYAKDEKRFFDDFAKAFQKLEELGVEFPPDTKTYYFKPLNE
ncbi:cytochrome c peroxidase mitochondrial precursor [Syncephalis plumigaleata]|nr:cytochrome c peroxidase mitochondrial precursor [Syncephalis plumigaleata]